jgi:hypothetical protein
VRWLGSGKWQLRELRAADPALADGLVSAIGDRSRLTGIAAEVLAGPAGGCGRAIAFAAPDRRGRSAFPAGALAGRDRGGEE